MADPTHRIYPDWKDVVVYDEGDGRTLRLDCDGHLPYQVFLPSADRWPLQTPDWAHDRRDIVIQRLRDAGSIICEVSEHWTTMHSPDGTFAVQWYYQKDERGYPMRQIRVVAGDRIVVAIDDAGLNGVVLFPQPGVVTLPFRWMNQRQQIGLDVHQGTFWCHPTDPPRPVEQLMSALVQQTPAQAPVMLTAARPSRRQRMSAWGMILGSLAFVATGIWQAIDGDTLKDHLIGALCVLFFGLCGASGVYDLRQLMRGGTRSIFFHRRSSDYEDK